MINTASKINLSKKRVQGRGVNLNLDNVCKYTVCLFLTLPLIHFSECVPYVHRLLVVCLSYVCCMCMCIIGVSSVYKFISMPILWITGSCFTNQY